MDDAGNLQGTSAWIQSEKVPDFLPVSKAVISHGGKRIEFYFKYHGKELRADMNSEDGIHFKGEYESDNHHRYNCAFTLFKNEEGCFLYGEYGNDYDGNGIWLVMLKK